MKQLKFFVCAAMVCKLTPNFKSGLETLLKDKPIRAIFLGVRIGDPTAVSLVFNLDLPSFCFCFELHIF
jgi:hypothetical protein